MIIHVKTSIESPDALTFRHESGGLNELLSELASRAYRRETGSRRRVSVWRWNADSWCESYGMFRGTLVGTDTGHGAPVLGECIAEVRYEWSQ